MEVEGRKQPQRRHRRRRCRWLGVTIVGVYVWACIYICAAGSANCWGRAAFISLQHRRSSNQHLMRLASNPSSSGLGSVSTPTSASIESSSRTETGLSPMVFSSPLLTSVTYSSPKLMDPIVHHPSLKLLDLEKGPRKKLKPRHKQYFLSSPTPTTTPWETSSIKYCGEANHDDTKTEKRKQPFTCSLFEKLALACCDSGVVPRKEFFETYASAKLIQNSFPENVHRVADLAAGHGLLSWMLLAMDDYETDGAPRRNRSRVPPRTAICVDRRIPPSAIAIARSMRHHLFPIESGGGSDCHSNDKIKGDDEALLYDRRWTYVQTDLNNVVVDDSSTLLVSVHACGTLSDFLINLAISSKGGGGGVLAPLALVPCCHTYSARKGYQPHPLFSGTTSEEVRTKIETMQEKAMKEQALSSTATIKPETNPVTTKARTKTTKTHLKFQIVENVIDEVRLNTLINAGYGSVRIASLPQEFTERNRLFLIQSKNATSVATAAIDHADGSNNLKGDPVLLPMEQSFQSNGDDDRKPIIRRGSMPPPITATTRTATTAGRQQLRPLEDEKNASANNHLSFVVHLRDDPESIEDCLSFSGRAEAIQRLRALIPNHFAPKLDVSMWLSPEPQPQESPTRAKTTTKGSTPKSTNDDKSISDSSGLQNTTNVTLELLQEVLDETVVSYRQKDKIKNNNNNNKDKDKRYRCTIAPINKLFVHPVQRRITCTYQIEYSYEGSTIEENGTPFPRNIAKELHKIFCDNVVHSIEGTEIR